MTLSSVALFIGPLKAPITPGKAWNRPPVQADNVTGTIICLAYFFLHFSSIVEKWRNNVYNNKTKNELYFIVFCFTNCLYHSIKPKIINIT